MDIQCNLRQYKKARGESVGFLNGIFGPQHISLATSLKHAKGSIVEIGEFLPIVMLGWREYRAETVEFLGVINLYFNMLLDKMELDFPELTTIEQCQDYLEYVSNSGVVLNRGKALFASAHIAKDTLVYIAEQISEEHDVSNDLAYFCTTLYDYIAFDVPAEHQDYAKNAFFNLLSMKFNTN